MGDVFRAVGTAASIFIPGAAPVVAAISGVANAIAGASSTSTGGTAPEEAAVSSPVFEPIDRRYGGSGSLIGYSPYPGGMGPAPIPGQTVVAFGDQLEAPRTWIPSVASGAPVPATFYDPNLPSPYGVSPQVGQLIENFFGPGGTFGVGSTAAVVGGGSMIAGGPLVVRGIQAIEAVVPKWILRAASGAATAGSIYELYKRLRGAGHSHKRARRLAIAAHGILLRRRRMRVTNIHALNRAIRRVRGFQRKARKVRHLFGRSRFVGSYHRGRRRFRRGDLDPFLVEDQAEMMDEAEDNGLEPQEVAYE